MTFSIAARCVRTGAFGVAISSSSPAVASRCAYVRAGVGAVCSQNVTDPRLGPALLDRLESGLPAGEAMDHVVAGTPHIGWRQLTAIGAAGEPAVFSGERVLGSHGSWRGRDCVAAGNMLADGDLPRRMTETFDARPEDPIAERLLAAMEAALACGGEEGAVHSAGLLVATDVPWPVTDLRVDWTEGDPVGELRGLWKLWRPQEAAYRQRGLDPEGSPGYGVPGDERPS